MGRVSRDARLLFVLLWTLADDSGRLRGSSRILASLLFPYDDDAKISMDNWIDNLENENCVIRYVIDEHTYLQILNWQSHQKIDHPSPSKLPPPPDDSRKPREASRGSPKHSAGIGRDQGRDQGRDLKEKHPSGVERKANGAARPTASRMPDDFDLNPNRREYATVQQVDPERTFENFRDYWQAASGAKARKHDWDATWRMWCRNEATRAAPGTKIKRAAKTVAQLEAEENAKH